MKTPSYCFNMAASLMLSSIFFISINAQTTLTEVINDMILPHECRPHGVPESWDWGTGPRFGAAVPPEGWDAAIAWGQLYECTDGNPAANTRVQIRDLEIYYLSNVDLQWHELQKNVLVEGAAYVEDFAGDVNKPADIRNESDGSISVTAGDGYNFHFWPKQGRTQFPEGEIKGIFATVRGRLILADASGTDDRENARYALSVGGDWWESLTAVWDNWTTNADMGIGRFRLVNSEWHSFNMCSLPADSVLKYPPPYHKTSPETAVYNLKAGQMNFTVSPNPVRRGNKVHFAVEGAIPLKISLYNLDGKETMIWEKDEYSSGELKFEWCTEETESGLYIIRLEAADQLKTIKCLVL